MYAIVIKVVKPAKSSFLTVVLFNFKSNVFSKIVNISFLPNDKFIIQILSLQVGTVFA